MEESDFYLEFENKFRGSRQQILDSLEFYNEILSCVYDNCPIKTVLDIGCGRGEWLEHCEKKGFKAIGIEMNKKMFIKCESKGFDVLFGDAIDLLKDLDDDSVSIVSGFHFIEHIENQKLNIILCEIKRILSPAGVLIFETPSIDNLSVSSKLFYLDPTHINPINPDEIIFRLTQLGFLNARYFYMKPGPLVDSYTLSMTRILNGVSQDLLVLATKSSLNKYLNYNDFYLNMKRKSSISTMQAATEFDREVVYLKSKLLEQEISIFKLKQNLNKIEKLYSNSSNYHFFSYKKFAIKLIKKILSIFKKLIKKILKISSKIYSFISFRIPLYFFLRFILYIRESNFLTGMITNILYRCGQNDNPSKLYIRVKEAIILDKDIDRINNLLHNNFIRSNLSKTIYKELIKNDIKKEE
tara:strand:- start:18017 stop:19252 length:1236 start_codon:yes stop_codon:yes gene_type:complete